jgi:hypothetical protein
MGGAIMEALVSERTTSKKCVLAPIRRKELIEAFGAFRRPNDHVKSKGPVVGAVEAAGS